MTTYYDPDGAVTGSAVTVHEPRFSPDDLTKALDRHWEKQGECPGCGQPRDEVQPDDPHEFHAEEKRWHARTVKCVACAARDREKRRHGKGDNVDTDGIHFPVRRD